MVDYDKFNSKIYLFLSQQADWKTDADYDGDDKITKAEFMDYLKGDVAKEIWDGENCNANRKNDVINKFWNRFDQVRSGYIEGTNVKEYNALNDDEEAALEKSFASYKYFNEFFNNEISKIQSAGISELNTKKVAEQLKSSLKTDLLALFEAEVSKGTEFNSVEDVKNVLGDQVRQVEYQTIANISVDLYIEKNVKNLEKKYGYDRENDATLNTLIKNCVSQLASSSNIDDFAGVFNEAMNVIENYLATALPDKFSGNDEYLKKYGYDFNAEDGLNDLQKAVFKTNLANELPKSEYKDLYKEYPYVFEILSEQLVDTLQYKEYTTDVVALFKEKMGTKVENAISVAKLFNKPESGAGNDAIETKLWAALKEKGFSDELIEYLQGNGATKLDGIKKEAITATVNDEFNDIDDKFDINNAVDYIVEKIVAMQLELEKAMNGADNLSVDESTWNVNISVTTGGTSGTDSTGSTDSPTYDLEASKKSAIATIKEMIKNATEVEVTDGNYQDYVNPQLLTTIETIFGGYNYKAIIDNIAKIEELNRLMEEFLSVYNASWEPVKSTTPTSGTDSSNGVTTTTKTNFNLSKDLKFYQGSQVSFKLNPKFNYKNTNKQADVDSSKVTYESSNPNLVAIGADGTVTICTDNITSQTKVTIKILVDGEVVGTKELKIEIAPYDKANAGDGFENDTTTMINGQSISDIFRFKNNAFFSAVVNHGNVVNTGISFIDTTLSSIESALIGGGYDSNKTKKTISVLKQYYKSILAASQKNFNFEIEHDIKISGIGRNDKKGDIPYSTTNFSYTGSDGKSHELKQDMVLKEWQNLYAYNPNKDNFETINTSGFVISHQRNGNPDQYQIALDTAKLLTLFKDIYQYM